MGHKVVKGQIFKNTPIVPKFLIMIFMMDQEVNWKSFGVTGAKS